MCEMLAGTTAEDQSTPGCAGEEGTCSLLMLAAMLVAGD
jgi:hypothetical protein